MRISAEHVWTFLALLAAVPTPAWARGAVIANVACQETRLPVDTVRDIFLGKDREFPGGGAVEPVDQADEVPISQEFLAQVLGKTPKQLKSYWSLRIFTGRGTPPKTLVNDREVKEWVVKHPDALGYVDAKSVDPSVKVLMTFE